MCCRTTPAFVAHMLDNSSCCFTDVLSCCFTDVLSMFLLHEEQRDAPAQEKLLLESCSGHGQTEGEGEPEDTHWRGNLSRGLGAPVLSSTVFWVSGRPALSAHAFQPVIHLAHRGSLARCLRAPAVCACWRKARPSALCSCSATTTTTSRQSDSRSPPR